MTIKKIVLGFVFVAGLISCNKDDVLVAVEPEIVPSVGEFDNVFGGASYFQRSTTRYTYVGRPVFITPVIDGNTYSWTINGHADTCDGQTLKFTPEAPGEYTVGVAIDDEIYGEMKVVCVDHSEAQGFRSGDSRKVEVYEYVPAPGQFINNEVMPAVMTHREATEWATEALSNGDPVSLGSFGGYIIVGYGHSIGDFMIKGNAFTNKSGASNEPGIVYVMQDVNGNGQPDDEWYELRASETGSPSTIQRYAMTYYRPETLHSDVRWTDCFGTEGVISYMERYHSQDTYYPSWIEENQYTLQGTFVQASVRRDPDTGLWRSDPLESGYADNNGSNDNVFHIADAMFADQSPVKLRYVDFIKIQTGVSGQCGHLGELSTELTIVRAL